MSGPAGDEKTAAGPQGGDGGKSPGQDTDLIDGSGGSGIDGSGGGGVDGPGGSGIDGPGGGGIQGWFERVLAWSRLLALIPVIFLLLDAAGSFVYGADILVRTAQGDVTEPARVGGRLGIFLIVADTFLVGATLMIAAFGFYELFVIRKERARHTYWLPRWLRMRDLEDLKARVVSMLILVAAITFVDIAVESHDERGILFLGLGIAVVIIALTAFLRFGRRPETISEQPPRTHNPPANQSDPPDPPRSPLAAPAQRQRRFIAAVEHLARQQQRFSAVVGTAATVQRCCRRMSQDDSDGSAPRLEEVRGATRGYVRPVMPWITRMRPTSPTAAVSTVLPWRLSHASNARSILIVPAGAIK